MQPPQPGEVGLRSDSALLVLVSSRHAPILSLPPLPRFYWQQVFTIRTGKGTTGYPAALAPRGRAVCASDGFWYTNGRDPRLERYSDRGEPLQRVDLPIQLEEVSSHEKQAYEATWVGGVPADARPRLRSALRQMPYPRFLPATTAMIRSRDGDVWVSASTSARDTLRTWYVVSPRGRVLARVDLAMHLELLDAGRDFVLASRRDTLGLERVELFGLSQ